MKTSIVLLTIASASISMSAMAFDMGHIVYHKSGMSSQHLEHDYNQGGKLNMTLLMSNKDNGHVNHNGRFVESDISGQMPWGNGNTSPASFSDGQQTGYGTGSTSSTGNSTGNTGNTGGFGGHGGMGGHGGHGNNGGMGGHGGRGGRF
jgi:hypothetical protein